MSEPHVIRLRGPWTVTPLARFVRSPDGTPIEQTADLLPPQRVAMPADWGKTLCPDFRGRVQYVRRFNAPTNLELHEFVLLVLDGADARGDATFNGVPLGPIVGPTTPASFDVTSLLKKRNELAVVVELPLLDADQELAVRGPRAGLPGGLIGEVRLEIHERTQ